MKQSTQIMQVANMEVEVIRKPIRNLYIRIKAPDGLVRVSAPKYATNMRIRRTVEERLDWIIHQQQKMAARPKPKVLRYETGEEHPLFGEMFTLEVKTAVGKHHVRLEDGVLKLFVSKHTSVENRQKVMHAWYKKQLLKAIPELLEKWEPVVGKQASGFIVRRMRSRWGSCNILNGEICLNMELAKRDMACVEYVLVHELVHLHERYHNQHFKNHMTRCMPNWPAIKKQLNAEPLAHEFAGC